MTESMADRLRQIKPDLYAEVTLTTEATRPRLPGYRCPCIPADGIDAKPPKGYDSLPLLTEALHPGETRTIGFSFLTPEGAEAIRQAGRFYLSEGRIMSQAVVVPGPAPSPDAGADEPPAVPAP